jgi:mono/diheme cytochrome c family protein/plastocyanin
VNRILFLFFATLAMMAALAGGGRKPDDPSPSAQVHASVSTAPVRNPGRQTFSDFAAPPKPEVTPEFLALGKAVYEQNCAACHGPNGDAKADAAAFLLPKPRNFREAKFRLRSTASGSLPTDVDIFRSVSLGLSGTPMPPWKHMLKEDERWAVVEYIKTFSPRFADPKVNRNAVVDLGTPPARNEHSIAEGKAVYTKLNCFSCHGETGHGDGPSAATLVDDSGSRIKPRDFTKPGNFKAGYATKEIVRTILTGLDGTPMVGFNGVISTDEAWKAAYFVETFAKAPAPALYARPSQNFLEHEELGQPDVRIKVTERAWKYDPAVIRVQKGQIVEITFEPTDNGLGVGHGFAISSYDEAVFINGAMVGAPKTVKFRADRAGKFTYYCATQCSTEKLHPLMNGTLWVEEPRQTASVQ